MNQGVSNGTNVASQSGVSFVNNNIAALPEMTITLTLGTNSSANFSNLMWLFGANPAFLASNQSLNQPNQTATTGSILASTVSSGDSAGLAEYKAYMQGNTGLVREIEIIASAPSTIYSGYLFFNEFAVNGVVTPKRYVLAKYAQISANTNTFLPNLILPNINLGITRTLAAWFSTIAYSSTVSIILRYEGYGISSPITTTVQ